MSAIDRCPVCQHRFPWIFPSKEKVQCPECKTHLVETKRYQSLQSRLWTILIVLNILNIIASYRDRLPPILIIPLMLLLTGTMIFWVISGLYTILTGTRFEPVHDDLQ